MTTSNKCFRAVSLLLFFCVSLFSLNGQANSMNEAAPENKAQPQWHEIEFADASQHVGKKVQVNTSNGKIRIGVLTSVNEQSLSVTKRKGVNEMKYHLEKRGIRKLQVYF